MKKRTRPTRWRNPLLSLSSSSSSSRSFLILAGLLFLCFLLTQLVHLQNAALNDHNSHKNHDDGFMDSPSFWNWASTKNNEKEQKPKDCPIWFVILVPQIERLHLALAHAALLEHYGAYRNCITVYVQNEDLLQKLQQKQQEQENNHGNETFKKKNLLSPPVAFGNGVQVLPLSCPLERQPKHLDTNYKTRRRALKTKISMTYQCLFETIEKDFMYTHNITNTNTSSTTSTKIDHSYVAILEDDIMPSHDFVDYMMFGRKVMELDSQISCVSAFNEYTGKHERQEFQPGTRHVLGLDPHTFFLQEGFQEYGFLTRMTKIQDLQTLLLNITTEYQRTIDNRIVTPPGWEDRAFAMFLEQNQSCLYPEIPRSYLLEGGQRAYSRSRSQNGEPAFQLHSDDHDDGDNFADPIRMTSKPYMEYLRSYLQKNCHDPNLVRLYHSIQSNTDMEWQTVQADTGHAILWTDTTPSTVVGVYQGTMWASPDSVNKGRRPNRTLIVAGYSPLFTHDIMKCHEMSSAFSVWSSKYNNNYNGATDLTSAQTRQQVKKLMQQTDPVPFPLPDSISFSNRSLVEIQRQAIQMNHNSDGDSLICWETNNNGDAATEFSSVWTVSWPIQASADFQTTVLANLKLVLAEAANVDISFRTKQQQQEQSSPVAHIDFVLEGHDNCQQVFPFGSNERYSVKVSNRNLQISCCAVFGCLHGIRVFSQTIVDDHNKKQKNTNNKKGIKPPKRCIGFSTMDITDQPKSNYRGILMDTGRAYLSVPFIKKIIRGVSMLGLNAIHWHLTDDQSFPIEIKAFPALHQKGAYWMGKIHSICDQPKGSYYTQETLLELVAYAKVLGVRIIPELDIPSHTRSWGFGLPEIITNCSRYVDYNSRLAGFRPPYIVSVPLDITLNRTTEVVKIILGELATLFPDPWFHLGGDELPMECLQEVNIQELTKHIHIFEAEVRRFLEQGYNKTTLFWDDVDDKPGFDSGGMIMDVWHRNKINGYIAKKMPFIDTGNWYLDYVCKSTSECHNRPTTLRHQLTIGGEACAWELTEGQCKSFEDNRWIERKFDLVVWKKLIGFSEALWSNDGVVFDALRSIAAKNRLERVLELPAGSILVS